MREREQGVGKLSMGRGCTLADRVRNKDGPSDETRRQRQVEDGSEIVIIWVRERKGGLEGYKGKFMVWKLS